MESASTTQTKQLKPQSVQVWSHFNWISVGPFHLWCETKQETEGLCDLGLSSIAKSALRSFTDHKNCEGSSLCKQSTQVLEIICKRQQEMAIIPHSALQKAQRVDFCFIWHSSTHVAPLYGCHSRDQLINAFTGLLLNHFRLWY